MDLKYSYALDRNNNLVNINTLDRNSTKFGELFYCIGCNNHMIPKLGKIKIKHFAHKHNETTCSYETYLHKLAKNVFFLEYKKCLDNNLPFNITTLKQSNCNFYHQQYKFTCPISDPQIRDLTKYFDLINIEKSFNRFIPDILLQSSTSDKHLFIEFAVSHKCDANKLNSNNKIIEFTINDEYDLSNIINHNITYYDNTTRFFNFKQKIYDYSCNGGCKQNKIAVFIIYNSQKSRIVKEYPNEINKLSYKSDVAFYEILGIINEQVEFRNLYINKVLNSFYIKNLPIKNCYLCNNHAFIPIKEAAIFCKLSRNHHDSNMASGCKDYAPIENLLQCKKIHFFNESKMGKY